MLYDSFLDFLTCSRLLGVDAFTSMLSRTSALIPDSLFESLGMPRGQESMLDARHVRLVSSFFVFTYAAYSRSHDFMLTYFMPYYLCNLTPGRCIGNRYRPPQSMSRPHRACLFECNGSTLHIPCARTKNSQRAHSPSLHLYLILLRIFRQHNHLTSTHLILIWHAPVRSKSKG